MIRLVLFFIGVLGLAAVFSWLADNPGTIIVDWQGYHAEPTVFQVVVLAAALTVTGIIAWSLFRSIWTSPATVSHFLTRRRQQRGLDALSSGMIAIGAGDQAAAMRYALHAKKALPNEPMTHLLRAQAAQLSGDRATARRIYEAMLSAPDTEQLGLRGLYVEAQREGEMEAQRQFAERALRLNPRLPWPVEGLFALQCRDGDWEAALKTLNAARKNTALEKPVYDRRRAVLLTAQAMALEDHNSERALALAMEAHALARDLIPAAAIAGRLLAAKGNVARAAKVIQKTWANSPHPDLATAYAYARIGDSPRDRLDRVRQLAALNPGAIESSLAVATAALDAQDWREARAALDRLSDGRMTRAASLLMARLEKEENNDTGRAREWLARAAHAPRDAAWTADGIVTGSWAPVSPVTGRLDAVEWRVPVDESETQANVSGEKIDEFISLGAYETASGDIIMREPARAQRPSPPGPTPDSIKISSSKIRATTQTKPPSETAAVTPPPRDVNPDRSKQAPRDGNGTAVIVRDATIVDAVEVLPATAKPGAPASEVRTGAGALAATTGPSHRTMSERTKRTSNDDPAPLHAPDDPGPPDAADAATDPSRLPWPYRVS